MGIDARMFVRTKKRLTEKQVIELSWKAGIAFGPERFSIHHPEKDGKGWDAPRRALRIVKEAYTQDGPDIVPEGGEQLIEANLWTRYYGLGYERGDLPFLIMLAEWLEHNVPGGEVWYGGDSSGVLAEPFGKEARESLIRHWATTTQTWLCHFSDANPGAAPRCDLCGERPMTPYRWGGGAVGPTGFVCRGCGLLKDQHGVVYKKER